MNNNPINIIIPLGGQGKRFLDAGYKTPKPLINVLGKPMIFWLLDGLKLGENDSVFIFYNTDLDDYGFNDLVSEKYPDVMLVKVGNNTKSPVETLSRGLNYIDSLGREYLLDMWDRPTLLIDGDTFYNTDIINKFRRISDNCIVYSKNYELDPIYSYIKIENTPDGEYDRIVEIAEKIKISDNANTGAYGFKTMDNLWAYVRIVEQGYISDIYKMLINDEDYPIPLLVEQEDFNCIGTPDQLQAFCAKHNPEPQRICFDLDRTLVTSPEIEGDYTTTKPIQKNINFLKMMYDQGHTIIIYTARRMKTHNGNVGQIVADVGKITIDSLENFGIPYHELYFGKPYAQYYIDDLSISAHEDLEKALGYYKADTMPRTFNNIMVTDDTVLKRSSSPDFDGELYFYENMPEDIKRFFPRLISSSNGDDLRIELEKIVGTDLSKLYVNGSLDEYLLKKVLYTLDEIHSSGPDQDVIFEYKNYSHKIEKRFNRYPYEEYNDIEFDDISPSRFAAELLMMLNQYEKRGIKLAVIHGDPVFSNILLDIHRNLKFVDPRGKVGNKLTVFGDPLYDYAKVYQSIIGYDHILQDRELDDKYIEKMETLFEHEMEIRGVEMKNIKLITSSLLFSLIPLHDDKNKQQKYYELALKVFRKVHHEN